MSNIHSTNAQIKLAETKRLQANKEINNPNSAQSEDSRAGAVAAAASALTSLSQPQNNEPVNIQYAANDPQKVKGGLAALSAVVGQYSNGHGVTGSGRASDFVIRKTQEASA